MTATIHQFPKIRKEPTKSETAYFVEDQQTHKEIPGTSTSILPNQYTVFKMPNQTKSLVDFIDLCDPNNAQYHLVSSALVYLETLNELESGVGELELYCTKGNSPFIFPENNSPGYTNEHLDIFSANFTTELLTGLELNISELTSLLYAQSFDLFFDVYNNEPIKYDIVKIPTQKQIRHMATKENNQDLLNILIDFPKIDSTNLEHFLERWDIIKPL
jgi:hypothetical protein